VLFLALAAFLLLTGLGVLFRQPKESADGQV